ncbi:uncharacterized protein BYT42DRAFT_207926 [Radiomyces spectabilis]|uniref:uncharacterized protein n=1 Tax=Radiomyces spectabilis TaxID=64574 RepID=UPI002220677F|nr:uncharacterized protein BYT42DRAFT_207926 [Radiomyces spectabilis]KAI8391769.1 hypothetical protein BYT42DRAFT_207926 [Radiomyces spectabilis]
MNSLYNHALKQSQALQRDLDKFATGQDASAGLQGQITASFNSLQRSIDDYDNLAKRELIATKKETAQTRVKTFRQSLQEMKTRFEMIKKQHETQKYEQNRESLLARRPTRTSLTPDITSAPEYPYQSRSEFAMRQHSFIDSTDTQLDDFITQASNILENLTDQHGILKKTQKKLLDAANTLGLSQNVIRFIERRTAQDKWIFIAGLVVTILLIWLISSYLG